MIQVQDYILYLLFKLLWTPLKLLLLWVNTFSHTELSEVAATSGHTCRGNLCGPGPARCRCLLWCNQFHTATRSSPEQQALALCPFSVPSSRNKVGTWCCHSHLKSCWDKLWPCSFGTKAQHHVSCSCLQRNCGKSRLNWRSGTGKHNLCVWHCDENVSLFAFCTSYLFGFEAKRVCVFL